jgi:hypothetical protein
MVYFSFPSLSLWKRAGVRVLRLWKKPLTLSRGERGWKGNRQRGLVDH